MRKRLLVALGMLLLLSFLVAAKPIGDNLFGTWVNVDPDSGGIAQFYFGPDGAGGIQVYGYGVCDPTPCEWGATPLVLLNYPGESDAEWGMAIWDFGEGRLNVAVIHLAGDYMVVESYSILGPGYGSVALEILRYVP